MRICKIDYRDILPNRYAITDQGVIFDLELKKPISYSIDKDGYYRCDLLIRDADGNIRYRRFGVHRLVAIHFVENPNPDISTIVNHEDGNKKFNWARNLSWMTSRENTQHADANGLRSVKGASNGNSVFSEDFVRNVCEKYEKGLYPIDIFREIYPDQAVRTPEQQQLYRLLYNVKKRNIWCDVSKDYNFDTTTRHPDPEVSKVWRPRPDRDQNSYSEDDVRWICEQFEDGLTPPEVVDLIFVLKARDRMQRYNRNRVEDIVGSIWRGTMWRRISKDYDFNRSRKTSKQEYTKLFDEAIAKGIPFEHISSSIAKELGRNRGVVRREFRQYLIEHGMLDKIVY